MYDRCWNGGGYRLYVDSFQDIMFDKQANDTVAEYIRAKIRERVKDPKTAEMLSHRHHPYGTKRPPFESNYYEVFNQHNVELVDVRSTPIEELTETGLRTSERSFEFDVLIFATGFDAMSGPMMRMGVVGRDGRLLTEHWSKGPRTYLGIGIQHFPNLIMIAGPHCPLQNIPPLIEYQVDFATEMIRFMVANDIVEVEPAAATEDEWQAHIDQVASEGLYPLADSWYMGSNVKDKPRTCMIYLGGGDRYRAFCDEIIKKGYDGFEFR
ncbi:hypothetical protein [Paenibacillus medicaginis]|uniref:Cyclohexanone monooxygenase n=1 Tax=Paenibacillus medicaginis TaxID=1470560 RepID=A0ABV5BVE3_9BACL